MCALLPALAEQMEYMAPPWIQQETEFSLWIFNGSGTLLLYSVSVLGHQMEHSVPRAVSQA